MTIRMRQRSSASRCCCRLLGSTPAEAIAGYVQTLQRAIDCVSDAVALPQGYHAANTPHALIVNGNQPFPLPGSNPSVSLLVSQQYTFTEAADAPSRERWTVQLTGYWYYLYRRGSEDELLAMHWHPAGAAYPDAIRLPHLHIRSRLLSPVDVSFAKTHIPTGQVSLEHIIWYAITQLGTRPRRRDWATILGEALETT